MQPTLTCQPVKVLAGHTSCLPNNPNLPETTSSSEDMRITFRIWNFNQLFVPLSPIIQRYFYTALPGRTRTEISPADNSVSVPEQYQPQTDGSLISGRLLEESDSLDRVHMFRGQMRETD